ncbi:MAG TPA: AAA family ATPase [Candidatus Acidoferrum sp.]|nr:AAA family ATPase [Candidatus Acidoferrum sp.]
MFLDYFGLVEQPFGVTPDPRFLCLGPKHREALASLEYGVETDRGFLSLIAQPGMGKTTLLYQFLELQRSRARTAYVFQTDGTTRDLLRSILAELGIAPDAKDLPGLREALNRILLEEMRAGRRFILVIDEAQNLSERSLESVRLLSNFETPWKKLLQIVLAGQPQLATQLARPSLSQLRQRISSVIRLDPFSEEETCQYILHRLWVAGYQGPKLFSTSAQVAIAETSHGIPRNINTICFNAMSLAYSHGLHRIDSKIVHESLADVDLGALAGSSCAIRQLPSPSKSFAVLHLAGGLEKPKTELAEAVRTRTASLSLRSPSWRWLPLSLTAGVILAFSYVSAPFAVSAWHYPAIDFLPAMEAAEHVVASYQDQPALGPSSNDPAGASGPWHSATNPHSGQNRAQTNSPISPVPFAREAQP